MAESARYFGVSWSRQAAREALEACRRPHASGTWKVRLLASQDGGFHTESSPIDRSSDAVWKIALAPAPVDAHSCWLHHKTTNRQIYDQAKSARPGADDVVLWNDRGEVTETTIANLVVGLDGRLWTPPRDCGLLAGTYRAALLDEGTIAERRISAADLHRAGEVFLVNSVRGLWRAVLVSDR
jgi:para-aminobenzoate synthetase/4-amino-4-deoxychorismate lyase